MSVRFQPFYPVNTNHTTFLTNVHGAAAPLPAPEHATAAEVLAAVMSNQTTEDDVRRLLQNWHKNNDLIQEILKEHLVCSGGTRHADGSVTGGTAHQDGENFARDAINNTPKGDFVKNALMAMIAIEQAQQVANAAAAAAVQAAPANDPNAAVQAAPANDPNAAIQAAPANDPNAAAQAAPANDPNAAAQAAPANNANAAGPTARSAREVKVLLDAGDFETAALAIPTMSQDDKGAIAGYIYHLNGGKNFLDGVIAESADESVRNNFGMEVLLNYVRNPIAQELIKKAVNAFVVFAPFKARIESAEASDLLPAVNALPEEQRHQLQGLIWQLNGEKNILDGNAIEGADFGATVLFNHTKNPLVIRALNVLLGAEIKTSAGDTIPAATLTSPADGSAPADPVQGTAPADPVISTAPATGDAPAQGIVARLWNRVTGVLSVLFSPITWVYNKILGWFKGSKTPEGTTDGTQGTTVNPTTTAPAATPADALKQFQDSIKAATDGALAVTAFTSFVGEVNGDKVIVEALKAFLDNDVVKTDRKLAAQAFKALVVGAKEESTIIAAYALVDSIFTGNDNLHHKMWAIAQAKGDNIDGRNYFNSTPKGAYVIEALDQLSA